MAKYLQVEKLITGVISRAENTYLITVQITNVSTARVEKLEDSECKECGLDGLLASVDQIAIKLAGKPEQHAEGPAFGRLKVNSAPEGAAVYLDSESKGVTPVTIDQVSEGTHQLVISKQGYKNISKGVEIKKDQVTEIKENLMGQTGTLKVETTPAGAQVFMDGDLIGQTPLKNRHEHWNSCHKNTKPGL